MLSDLRAHEPALLLELILSQLDAHALSMCASAARWLRADAKVSAERLISQLIQTDPRVARWRRTSAAGSSDVLREARHIEAGVRYLPRIAGRYRLDMNVVLDISPTGHYANYSTASAETPGHCFRGVATVAGVLPSPDPASIDYLFLFDRGYTVCMFDGQQIPAERLQFVRPNYQCFSVSCLREGGVRDGRPCPVLYENEPGPIAEEAWAVPPGAESLAWAPLPGELGPAPSSDDPSAAGHASTPHSHPGTTFTSPRTLKRVAEKLAEWGDAGLAPLADTRRDPRQQPVRLDFDLKLADIRSEAETRVSAVNTS